MRTEREHEEVVKMKNSGRTECIGETQVALEEVTFRIKEQNKQTEKQKKTKPANTVYYHYDGETKKLPWPPYYVSMRSESFSRNKGET